MAKAEAGAPTEKHKRKAYDKALAKLHVELVRWSTPASSSSSTGWK